MRQPFHYLTLAVNIRFLLLFSTLLKAIGLEIDSADTPRHFVAVETGSLL